MTDSDTESFHSAVGCFSDREDTNISDTNLKSEEVGEGRKVAAIRDSKYEFDGFTEMQNKYSDDEIRISEMLFANRKGQILQNSSSSEQSSKCKCLSKVQNYDCVSTDKADFNIAMKIGSTQEFEIDDIYAGNVLDFQTAEWLIPQYNRIEKVLKSESDNKSNEISQRNMKLFEMNNRFKEGSQKFGEDNDKMSGIESKDSERGLPSGVMDNVNNVNMKGKVKLSEENNVTDNEGWDDWELEYAEKDESSNGILSENQEPPSMLISGEQNRTVVNSQSEVGTKIKEVKTSKSFWDWTEFGDVVAAVGEGLTNISSVVESGLGLPTPEKLVRNQSVEKPTNDCTEAAKEREEISSSNIKSYGKLFAGFGANVVTGSLDVLEALGRKTFEKLTVPEQGSEKRRFIFEPERGQNLSEVLRELRESRAEEAHETNCISKRELTFIDFFEKFSGMLHLEGLEMLSKNYLRKIPPQRRGEVNEVFAEDLANTLEEYQEDQEENFLQNFKEVLLAIALPYKVRLGSGLMDSYRRCQERLESLSGSSDQVFELFLECLADFTAETVQSVHKLGQLLLITATTVKQEPFSELHSLIGRQISFFSNHFAQHITAIDAHSEEIEELVTAIFLAAGDSFSYVQQSFRLLRPLLIL
uniref:Protein FAM114A2 n=1 Tax=Elaeophora elaphi TaxID=1147741 RepID=A0A0R3RPM0_9BILA